MAQLNYRERARFVLLRARFVEKSVAWLSKIDLFDFSW